MAVALPLRTPLPVGSPVPLEMYGLVGEVLLAPVLFLSAVEYGCVGDVDEVFDGGVLWLVAEPLPLPPETA